MVLQRFIKFIADKANDGSVEHERELQRAADQFPEITDDVIAAYIGADDAVEIEEVKHLDPASDDPGPEQEKWCAWHKRMEPISGFGPHRRNGFQAYCRDGVREYGQQHKQTRITIEPVEDDPKDQAEPQKWCNAHQRMEPISNFNRSSDKSDGYRTCCREYDKEQQAIRRAQKRLNSRYFSNNRATHK